MPKTMNTALAVLGGLLLIVCGEAIREGLKDWHDLTEFSFVMGMGVQVAGLISVYVGGLYTPKPGSGQ